MARNDATEEESGSTTRGLITQAEKQRDPPGGGRPIEG